ncbi:MAG TPA: hypothetical protein VF953_02125 [Terriglobales bacterium]
MKNRPSTMYTTIRNMIFAVLLGGVALMMTTSSQAATDRNQPNSFVAEAGAITTAPIPSGLLNNQPEAGVETGAGWTMQRIAEGFIVGSTVGDGRNDGVGRVYGMQIVPDQPSVIREFTYDDGQGMWMNTSNFTLPFYAERALAIGDASGDRSSHLYVGCFGGGFSGDAMELTWNGTTWDSQFLGDYPTGQQYVNLAVGPGRGDDVSRLYFATGSSPPNNIAREYSHTDAIWVERQILALPRGVGAAGQFGIAVGDGRSDGITRVYGTIWDLTPGGLYVYELTWNGTSWDAGRIDRIPSQAMAVAVGDGHNDGVNRLYVVGRQFGVYEYSFDQGAWSLTSSIPVGTESFDVALGPARNDGVNRLYIPRLSAGTLTEASYSAGNWSVETVGTPGGGLFRVQVGKGRNDKNSRVYTMGIGGLFEFEFRP